MTDAHDIFTDHYRRLRSDAALRARLVEQPKEGLTEHFGSVPPGDYTVRVITQEPGKITILLPTPPGENMADDAAIDAVSRRIFDILFTDGVGGYLIPDDRLMWVLRDMRSTWSRRSIAGTVPETADE